MRAWGWGLSRDWLVVNVKRKVANYVWTELSAIVILLSEPEKWVAVISRMCFAEIKGIASLSLLVQELTIATTASLSQRQRTDFPCH